MRDFRIFTPTHHFQENFEYDANHQQFRIGQYESFSLKDVKWCYLYSYRKGCYPNRAYSIKFYIETKEYHLATVWTKELIHHEDVCAFLRKLGIKIAETSFMDKTFMSTYKEQCARKQYADHGLDYDTEMEKQKELKAQQVEWSKKHVWPIAKWSLIGFWSFFGICFLAAIFGII